MNPPGDVNRETVELLSDKIGTVIRDFYIGRDPSRTAVFEVLNALGIVVGNVLAGTGVSPQAVDFFLNTIHGQAAHNLTNEEGGGHA